MASTSKGKSITASPKRDLKKSFFGAPKLQGAKVVTEEAVRPRSELPTAAIRPGDTREEALRVLKKDPACPFTRVVPEEQWDALWALPKSDRVARLTYTAVRYILSSPTMSEDACASRLGRPGAQLPSLVSWYVDRWTYEMRPKTWFDSLPLEGQAKYASVKREYDSQMYDVNTRRAKALEAYKKELQACEGAEMGARQLLENFYADWDVEGPPRVSAEETLRAQLASEFDIIETEAETTRRLRKASVSGEV